MPKVNGRMAGLPEEEYEQVIDAFASGDVGEIVHVILNEEQEKEKYSRQERIQPNEKVDADDESVIMVPPLLTRGRDQERIPISVGELRRRIEPPESLCTTNLLHLLHLTKQRMPDVQETLGHYGLNRISKRSGIVSMFTKLSETEASHLAEDMYFLTSRSLNLKEIGESVAEQNGGWERFEAQANETKSLLEQTLHEVETRDKNLNLVTHGFSPLIIRAVIDIIAEILTPKEGQL